jgi:hypothetical protein
MLMLGLLPLLLFTFSGVMIMAAQQTLATASAEGARASLRYGTAANGAPPPAAARTSMQWLLFFRQNVDCSNGGSNAIVVSAQALRRPGHGPVHDRDRQLRLRQPSLPARHRHALQVGDAGSHPQRRGRPARSRQRQLMIGILETVPCSS